MRISRVKRLRIITIVFHGSPALFVIGSTFYDKKERTKIACHNVRDCITDLETIISLLLRDGAKACDPQSHALQQDQTLFHMLRARKIKDKTQSSWSLVSLVSFLTLIRHSGNVNPSLCCPPMNETTCIQRHREPVVPHLLATRLSVVSCDGELQGSFENIRTRNAMYTFARSPQLTFLLSG